MILGLLSQDGDDEARDHHSGDQPSSATDPTAVLSKWRISLTRSSVAAPP
jgi:hypothetical protein